MCALQIVVAQDTIPIVNNTVESDTIIVKTQPLARGRNATVFNMTNDSVPTQVNSVVKRKGDPMKATMLSAVFPGGGQILNRKYWKLPIVYAGFGALIYMYKINTDNYQMYYNGYLDFTDETRGGNSYLKFLPDDPSTYERRVAEEYMIGRINYHKRYRDLSIILTGVWYFAQILDANVDASLLEYDVSDNLELALFPKMFNAPGMQLFAGVNLRFTINF